MKTKIVSFISIFALAFPIAASAAVNITGITLNGQPSYVAFPGEPITIAVTYTSTGSNDVESVETDWTGDASSEACTDITNTTSSGTFTKTIVKSAPIEPATYQVQTFVYDLVVALFGSDLSIFGIQIDNNICLGADREHDTAIGALTVVVPADPELECGYLGGTWDGASCVFPTPIAHEMTHAAHNILERRRKKPGEKNEEELATLIGNLTGNFHRAIWPSL